MNQHILLLGLFVLLLLSSVAAAQTVNQESYIYATTSGNVVRASLLRFETDAPPKEIEAVRKEMNQIISYCENTHGAGTKEVQGCLINESRKRSLNIKYPVNFSSVKGANFSFTYLNPFANGPVKLDCKDKGSTATADKEFAEIDPEGRQMYNIVTGDPMQYWVAECEVDPGLYKGRRIQVTISYIPPKGENIEVAIAKVELANTSTNANFLAFMDDAVKALISGSAKGEVQVVSLQTTLPCLGAFLVMGLLLASMYFSGRSPITLLDITTPRLPSPKGFAAGGQIIAPFGYTEMKRVTRRKMAAVVDLAGALATFKLLSPSEQNALNRLAGRIKDAGDAAVFKELGAQYLKNGGKISELGKIAKPFSQMTESDHATYRQVLNKLERVGGRTTLFAKAAADRHLSKSLMETLDTLTYKGGKVTGKVQTVVGKLYGVDRYAVLGPIVTGSLDSMLRSTSKLKDLTKAGYLHGKQFVRESGKWAVQTVAGRRALEDMKARSPWLYKELTKKAKPVTVGGMMPIDQKMAHFYGTLHEELHRDQIRFLLKQIYGKMGVNTSRITDDVVFEMSYKHVDLLKLAGYKESERMKLIEAKIAQILSSKEDSIVEKKAKMESLYKSLGGTLDTNYIKMRERLEAIASDPAEGHVKLVALVADLDRENQALKAAKQGESRDDNKYYSLVGRGTLRGSDLIEVALFRGGMIHDFENGHATPDANFRNFMNRLALEMENEIGSLDRRNALGLLPEFMRSGEVAADKAAAVRDMFAENLTAEGERVLGLLRGKNRNNATIDDFMAVLYGNEQLLRSQGITKNDKYGVHIDPKTGKTLWWEEDKAIGPQSSWWKTDMKRNWRAGLDTRDLGQVGAWVEAKFTRSYVRPHDPAIEAQIDRYAGSKTWSLERREMETKKYWVREHIDKRMHNWFNDRFAMTYGGATQETMRFYSHAAAALLLKRLRDSGNFQERHTDIQFLEKMDVNNPKDMERLKYMIGDRYKKEFAEILKQKVTFDDIAMGNTAWLQTHEGSYLPYRDGMPASDNDRMVGGHPTLRDEKGVVHRFVADDVEINLPEKLMREFQKNAGSTNREDWQPLLRGVDQWATTGGYNYEKERVRAAVNWRYGNVTQDYMSFGKHTAVQVTPRHETMPLAPSPLRFFGNEAPSLMNSLKPFRDYFHILGSYMVRSAYDGTGMRYIRSYDLTPKSNILKMHSWRMASEIMTTNWDEMLKDVTSEYDKRKIANSFRSIALAHGAFGQVQAFTVDRHPAVASTSHGAHQGWSAMFGAGPADTIPLRANLRAYMDKYEYTSFMAQHGWAALLANKPFRIFQRMMSGAQRSMQGYASIWDTTTDPLKPFGNYTSPRILEAMRFMNPMSYSWSRPWAGSKLEQMNKWKSRAEQAQLTGYEHAQGLKRTSYSDLHVVYRGMDSIARNHLANPGATVADTRYVEQLASTAAEYSMMRMGPMAGYFRNDPYVRSRALSDTIRRTVSSEALAIKRQQELMGFGVMQNSLYSWFSPVTFAWHMGIPGFPQTLTPRDLITKAANRWKRGYGAGNLQESITSMVGRTGRAMARGFTPWKASLVRYCSCGTPGYKMSACKSCGTRL